MDGDERKGAEIDYLKTNGEGGGERGPGVGADKLSIMRLLKD